MNRKSVIDLYPAFDNAAADDDGDDYNVIFTVLINIIIIIMLKKVKGIRFIVLYPPKRSHVLPPLAGLYTWKRFQSPGGYPRATGSI